MHTSKHCFTHIKRVWEVVKALARERIQIIERDGASGVVCYFLSVDVTKDNTVCLKVKEKERNNE